MFRVFSSLERRSKTPSEFCIGALVFLLYSIYMHFIQIFAMLYFVMSELPLLDLWFKVRLWDLPNI